MHGVHQRGRYGKICLEYSLQILRIRSTTHPRKNQQSYIFPLDDLLFHCLESVARARSLPSTRLLNQYLRTETVDIDNEFHTVSASDIERKLNASQFGARIKRDAGAGFVIQQGNRYMTEETLAEGSSSSALD